MPKAKTNPSRTLDKILKLIDNDVKMITKTFIDVQMDHQSAQTLCRYATTLAGIREAKDKDAEKDKKELSKLSTDELMALYKADKA
jgi:hypothetical protein